MQLSELSAGRNGVVLFFDEFDEIACEGSPYRNILLTLLDSESGAGNPDYRLLIMAAANNFGMLDKAIIRDGRIDVKLEIPNPSKNEAMKMIKGFFDREKEYVEPESGEIPAKIYESCKTSSSTDIAYQPSCSGLKTFFEKLKAKAFDLNIKTADGKLLISDEVVREFAAEEDMPPLEDKMVV